MRFKTIFSTLLISLTVNVFVLNLHAQFSTAETLEKGETYTEINFWTGTQSHQNGGMQVYGGRFGYGVNDKMEIGIGGSFSNPHDVEFPPEIQPNIKYKFYEKHKITASFGVTGSIPIAKREGTTTFAMVYGNVSKKFTNFNEATLTAGVYGLVGHNKDFGSNKGMNFSIDQPITKKISFNAQWMTGKNRFGYFTPGLSIKLGENSNLFIGYSIGNYDYDNHGPYVSYSFFK